MAPPGATRLPSCRGAWIFHRHRYPRLSRRQLDEVLLRWGGGWRADTVAFVIRILLRRGWLVAAPVWIATSGSLLWAAHEWGWWEWVRNALTVLAVIVGIVSVITFYYGFAVLTPEGFWVPGQGRGRWRDVIDRDDVDLTLRQSDRTGSPSVVSFDRVTVWPATGRLLDAHVPAGLPRLDQAVPNPEFAREVDAWIDHLLEALAARCELPHVDRRWMLPTDDLAMHHVLLAFEPTVGGSRIEVQVSDDYERPIIKVDGCFACEDHRYTDEGDYEELDDEGRSALDETVAIVSALLSDVPRTPLVAWRIVDADGHVREFYPQRVWS